MLHCMSKKSKKSGAEGKSTNLPETNSVELHFSLAVKLEKEMLICRSSNNHPGRI
jgi:hypothetical protein